MNTFITPSFQANVPMSLDLYSSYCSWVWCSYTLTRLDYGYSSVSTAAGLPNATTDKTQDCSRFSINVAARIVYTRPRVVSIIVSPFLLDFHWLWAPQRSEFHLAVHLAVLVYRWLNGKVKSWSLHICIAALWWHPSWVEYIYNNECQIMNAKIRRQLS